MIRLRINNQLHDVDAPGDMPLLWVVRDIVGLTGSKFGCGAAQCGCCTMHVDGEAVRTCVLPVSQAIGKHVTTIEGLSADGTHPVQEAWIAQQVPQCGYCQSGQIMAAAALVKKHPNPSDAQIDETMSNICRCGTYPRVRAAIHQAVRSVNA